MQALVQDGLISTQHIRHGGIFKRKDGSAKAKSNDFDLSLEEIELIDQAFAKPVEKRDVPLTILDVPYQPVRLDDTAIYAKHPGKGGLIVARTLIFYIVAVYDEGMYPAIAVEAVERLGKSQVVVGLEMR